MLRIGQFSKICQVSIKTLRYYDELDLFSPVNVDPINDYRYYSVDQLPRLNRILALKDLGFPLEQIASLMEQDLSSEELRRMLDLRKTQLEGQIDEMQMQLAQVEIRIQRIEKEGKMPEYEIVLKTVEPVLVAARRVVIPSNEQVPKYLTPAFDEAYMFLNSSPVKITGPGIAIWYTPVEAKTDEIVDAAFPIEKPLEETDEIKMHTLPQEYVASVIHQGDFADFLDCYGALLKWIEANNYKITGPFREVYHKWDIHDQSDTTTEVQVPVEKN